MRTHDRRAHEQWALSFVAQREDERLRVGGQLERDGAPLLRGRRVALRSRACALDDTRSTNAASSNVLRMSDLKIPRRLARLAAVHVQKTFDLRSDGGRLFDMQHVPGMLDVPDLHARERLA